ncbi:glycosyltransferase family 2 protein [Persicobacter diffluens]|uniref:Glycosyl transferase family 2 n=1 Tax=Persicobacter diffluens TaxID=981 RepID=A0AAN4W1F5_9BACT|nr:glycosyl transferase family 2 [Persicobacter diffluens]
MPQPLVSSIIPFYNSAETLAQAIESLLQQDYPRQEIILVNNNADQASRLIAKTYSEQHPQIHLFTESRQGVMFAFNKGLANSKGDFILRLDADDIALPSRISDQIHFLQTQADVDLCSGLVRFEKGEIPSGGFQKYVDWVNSIQTEEEIKKAMFIESPIVNPSLMFRKSSLDKFGTYRAGNFPEDYELLLRWQEKGAKMAKTDNPVIIWRDSASRLTRTNFRYTEENFYKIKSEYLMRHLKQIQATDKKIMIWGAGKKTKQRIHFLKAYGLAIHGYIDVDPKKCEKDHSLHYLELPDKTSEDQLFILSLIAIPESREKIKQFLLKKSYKEGRDFILFA